MIKGIYSYVYFFYNNKNIFIVLMLGKEELRKLVEGKCKLFKELIIRFRIIYIFLVEFLCWLKYLFFYL